MKGIKSLNECFIRCFANADTFKNAQKTSDIDVDISDLINNKIPAMLSDYIKGNYIVCGSVGKGLATKTPWVAILDREITTSTREGVYVVFLFASDFKHVYLTLNQGTTVPGAFGPRLGKKEVSRKSQGIRELLKIDNELLCKDGNADIADEKYRAGAVYYTLWDVYDVDKGKDLLALYLNIYKQYKNLTQMSNVKIKSQIEFKMNDEIDIKYRSYVSAIKSKPFLLLAGISGTGKSRIVRELARACWVEGSEEYKAQKPKNFEMVQVKPNWHDSSELIGYVSRVSGSPVFVAGDFLKFVAKAWETPVVPYFLCLDEMNLAPVEQYFAEYLSVVESRKCQENGTITTDPIIKNSKDEWYKSLVKELSDDKDLQSQFIDDGITIPQNLIVVGTVNMDETTFSFSRKVLDRAMTIEMNEVDLYGGLDSQYEKIGKLEAGNLIGTAVEGVDVYQDNKDVCDMALKYLEAVNTELEGTPFKVAYRTRNEFLLYVVNNLPYNKDQDGNELEQNFVIARALDEITSMKILSRIEGDETKIGKLLDKLSTTIGEQLKVVSEKEYSAKKDDGEKVYSVSLAKLEEMKKRLESGYTSFWS
jgi:DNA polymerase III delta prime subunit